MEAREAIADRSGDKTAGTANMSWKGLLNVIDGGGSKMPQTIDVTPTKLDPRRETLDDVGDDLREALAAEVQAEELLKFRREARIAAQDKWKQAKRERGLE